MALHKSSRGGALVMALALAVGCQVFDPDFLPVKPADPPRVDAGGAVCPNGSKRPPAAPDIADTSQPGTLVFALKDVVLNNVSASLNVDRICTSQTGEWGCLAPAELDRYLEGETPLVRQDGPLGEENQFAREVFPFVNGFFDTDQGSLNITAQTAQAQGIGNPLIRIEGYNGEADDPRVTVVISQSVFMIAAAAGATMPPPVCVQEYADRGGVPHVPHEDDVVNTANPALTECFGDEIPKLEVEQEFNSNDIPIAITGFDPAWHEGRLWAWGRSDTFDRDARPLVMDDLAYVSDWTLVARLPDNVEIKMVGEGQAVVAKFTDAFAVAKLKPDLSGSEPNEVLVAGRWSMNALLETASSVGICPGSIAYNVARAQLEPRTDVRSARDQQGTEVNCDAYSFGITMTAHRANFGGIALGQPVPNACAE
jgi:hypothetical protein